MAAFWDRREGWQMGEVTWFEATLAFNLAIASVFSPRSGSPVDARWRWTRDARARAPASGAARQRAHRSCGSGAASRSPTPCPATRCGWAGRPDARSSTREAWIPSLRAVPPFSRARPPRDGSPVPSKKSSGAIHLHSCGVIRYWARYDPMAPNPLRVHWKAVFARTVSWRSATKEKPQM